MFSFLQKKIQKWYDHKFRNSKGSRRIKKVCGSCCSVFVLLFPKQLLAPLFLTLLPETSTFRQARRGQLRTFWQPQKLYGVSFLA
ncbi:hypothetical protein MEL_039b [Marseillevirus sp. 'Melbournevirus']|nr:hypothetical protein MEL_039b [Melbournevirus]